MTATIIHLDRSLFAERQRYLVSHGTLGVTIFRSDSGVDTLQLYSDRVHLEILPFQGQQIWNAAIDGRDITMTSLVDIPVPSTEYLRNYGAFLVHCGITGMGGPSADDTHALHGELPNAPYNQAWLVCDFDDDGNLFIELHGIYNHQVAMTVSYEAHPVIRVTEGKSIVDVSMTVTNDTDREMDLMYLAHMNFLPVNGSEIVGTHHWDPDHMRVRSSLPSHVKATDEFRAFLKETEQDPSLTRVLEADQSYDPEVVMTVEYESDEHGWAHTLQVHPEGTSDYVAHQPESAPKAIRCIQRTPVHQCVGMAMPATSEVEGYIAEKAKGNVPVIGPREQYGTKFKFGTLDRAETIKTRGMIDSIMSR